MVDWRDIDVLAFTENMQPLTREKLGYPKRKCLLCTEEAKVCGRSKNAYGEKYSTQSSNRRQKKGDDFYEKNPVHGNRFT